MTAVWSGGKVTVARIQAALAPKRVLKDSTVRTVLTRLEEKGYVRHELDGRAFVYSSVERPEDLAVRAVKQLIDRLCHGSLESLLTGLVDAGIVDRKELRRIVDRVATQHLQKASKSAKTQRSAIG